MSQRWQKKCPNWLFRELLFSRKSLIGSTIFRHTVVRLTRSKPSNGIGRAANLGRRRRPVGVWCVLNWARRVLWCNPVRMLGFQTAKTFLFVDLEQGIQVGDFFARVFSQKFLTLKLTTQKFELFRNFVLEIQLLKTCSCLFSLEILSGLTK